MKTLIFSDSHLDSFDEKKFRFLASLIKSVDQVVINGDFWEGYTQTFDEFIKSPWQGLFKTLKQKESIYLYGNHDRKRYADSKVNLFSKVQAHEFALNLGDKILKIEHGHRFDKLIKVRTPKKARIIAHSTSKLEEKLLKSKNRRLLKLAYHRHNKRIMRQARSELDKNQYFLCGHTHLAEVNEKYQFINSGMINHGLGQYIIVDNNQIFAKEEWYS